MRLARLCHYRNVYFLCISQFEGIKKSRLRIYIVLIVFVIVMMLLLSSILPSYVAILIAAIVAALLGW